MQVGDVDDGDEQNKSHCAEQNQQSLAHVADKELFHGNNDGVVILRPGVLFLNLFCNAGGIGGGLCFGNTWLEAADRKQPKRRALLGRLKLKDRPQVAVRPKAKAERHNAYDGVAFPIEVEIAADRGWVAVKEFLPEVIAHNNREGASRLSFFRKKRAAHDRLNAQNRKKVWRYRCSGNQLRSTQPCQRDTHRGRRKRGNVFERLLALVESQKIRVAHDAAVQSPAMKKDPHQAVRLGEWERL